MSFPCGLVFCSINGELFTQHLKKKFKETLSVSVYLMENEYCTQFILDEEMQKILKNSLEKINQPNGAEEYALTLKQKTKELKTILNEIDSKKILTLGDLTRLEEKFYEQVSANIPVKISVDYLPKKRSDEVEIIFEGARKDIGEVYSQFESLLKKFSSRAKSTVYTKTMLATLTLDELKTYLKNQLLPSPKVLHARTKGTCLVQYNNRQEIFTGIEYKEIKQILQPSNGNKTLLGMCAFPGKVTGYAKIIFNPRNLSEFKSGNILVTGMTRPEFLPIMNKASAIITDVGGILSHAAILARELKKPCIIGTRLATSTIKDGDFLEIDASKGSIIIKNA